jgi:glycosyltransferase involved in cell wall biosynthesis
MNVLMATNSPDNPYLQLLTDALEGEGLTTTSVDFPPIFPFTARGVFSDDIDVIHLDWMYQFYLTTPTSLKALNTLATMIRSVCFIIDLFIVSMSDTGLVWTVHDIHNHKKRFQRSERAVYEALFVFSDEVVTKCDAAGQILENQYLLANKEAFNIIRDGNYRDKYPHETTKTEARETLSVDGKSFVFLFFGLIKEYKGIDLLIEEFQQLDLPDAELWVVGNPAEDGLENKLRQKANNNDDITLRLEFIPNEDVQHYMNMADVIVLPFRKILNSGSVYLGLTFGLPIITPRMGCIPTTVPEENMELMYDASPEGLYKSLESAYNNSELNGIAEANRKRGEELSWEKPAQQLSQMYREMI